VINRKYLFDSEGGNDCMSINNANYKLAENLTEIHAEYIYIYIYGTDYKRNHDFWLN